VFVTAVKISTITELLSTPKCLR